MLLVKSNKIINYLIGKKRDEFKRMNRDSVKKDNPRHVRAEAIASGLVVINFFKPNFSKLYEK